MQDLVPDSRQGPACEGDDDKAFACWDGHSRGIEDPGVQVGTDSSRN